MRIPYVPNPPPTTSESDAAIVSRVQARRGSRGLIPLDLALLHSPPVADGWNTFLGAVRTQTTLPPDLRELIICRVAVHNQAWFEWAHHAPLLRDAGMSEEVVEVVKRVDAEDEEVRRVLGAEMVAVLRYTDAMTKTVRVPEEVFGELRRYFGEREVVEITATAAAYNCVSRFLVALDVGEMNEGTAS
ncbi:hypothetical protein FQN54_000252 [Arachnomyces sp. PD_36]|nr:hypothetical protein FQN54_000252 [Arachnomyces sp. PD_36]